MRARSTHVSPACGVLPLAVALAIVACSPGPPPSGARAGALAEPTSSARTVKTITAAIGTPIVGFGPLGPTGPLSSPAHYIEVHSNSLTTADAQGRPTPQLAEQLPSLDDGTAKVTGDG